MTYKKCGVLYMRWDSVLFIFWKDCCAEKLVQSPFFGHKIIFWEKNSKNWYISVCNYDMCHLQVVIHGMTDIDEQGILRTYYQKDVDYLIIYKKVLTS